jgi:hypothetical protein
MKAEVGRRFDTFEVRRQAEQASRALEEEAADLQDLLKAADAVDDSAENPNPQRVEDE